MKVVLKDIADDTGFSVSTVSRVLNGSHKISVKTQKKVLESAEKLDYKLTKSKTTSSSDTLNIALVGTGFHEGEFYSSFFHGLNKSARQNDARLFLTAVENHEKELLKVIKNMSSEYYDGIILFVPELRREGYEKIRSMLPNKYPIVSNSLIENPIFPTVTFDSYSGGFLAADHFFHQGYDKVGIILGPSVRSESRFRRNVFNDYIQQQNKMELVWVCNGDFTFNSGVKAFETFKNATELPEAIFASNDSMAYGFLQSAKESEFDIPEDVAIIGYDDLPNNLFTYPKISSIHTDYQKLGDATIKALYERIQQTDLDSNMLSFVPVSVSHRETT